MPNVVTQRFVACHDHLKQQGMVRSSRQFALELNYRPQNLNEILKGNRDVPIELLRIAMEKFGISPMFLFKGAGSMFVHDDNLDTTLKVLSVVTDNKQQEKIIHVPVPAQAGYSNEVIDPVFYKELPAYSLPDHHFNIGTFRSFDVSGDSMSPTLLEGDKVICSFTEPSSWIDIKDHDVYVIVTRNQVLVKRVVNQLSKHRHFQLISDNLEYSAMRLNVRDIKELWRIHSKLATFSHATGREREDSLEGLRQTIVEQSAIIAKLTDQLSQILPKQ